MKRLVQVDCNAERLKTLIAEFNVNSAYIDTQFPNQKYHFLSDYLLYFYKDANTTSFSNLLGFLEFLFEHGACLDGVYVIQDQLIRAIFKSGNHVRLLHHLFKTQKLKLEEELTLMHYSSNQEFGKQFERGYRNEVKKHKANAYHANVALADPNKKDYSSPYYKTHACYLSADNNHFVYINYKGLFIVEATKPTIIQELKSIFSPTPTTQYGVIASTSQVSLINSQIGNKIINNPPEGHPIRCVEESPESTLSTYLLEHCEAITYARDTVPMLCARFNCLKLLSWYLSKNPDTDLSQRNLRGESALDIAVQQNNLHVVIYLLNHGASLTDSAPNTGYTVYHLAILYRHHDLLTTFSEHLFHKKRLYLDDICSDIDNTILHWAFLNDLLINPNFLALIRHLNPTSSKTEDILCSVFRLAYQKLTPRLLDVLMKELWDMNYKDNLGDLLIKLIRCASSIDKDGFYALQDLAYFVNKVLPNYLAYELENAPWKLCIFLYEQNQPELAQSIQNKYKIVLGPFIDEQQNLLHQCMTKRAYRSASALIQQGGCPRHGLVNIMGFSLQLAQDKRYEILALNAFPLDFSQQDTDGQGLGHYFILDDQTKLMSKWISLVDESTLLAQNKSNNETALDVALRLYRYTIIMNLITKIISITASHETQALFFFSQMKQRLLLVKFIINHASSLFPNSQYLLAGLPLIHFAYHCLQTIPNEFITITENLNSELINQFDSSGNSLIASLINNNQFDEALRLVNTVTNIRVIRLDSKGSSLLHLASEKGNLAIVEYVFRTSRLQTPTLIRKKDGLCALDLAIMNGHIHIVTYLWKKVAVKDRPAYLRSFYGKPNATIYFPILIQSGMRNADSSEKKVKSISIRNMLIPNSPTDSLYSQSDQDSRLGTSFGSGSTNEDKSISSIEENIISETSHYVKIMTAIDEKNNKFIKQIKSLQTLKDGEALSAEATDIQQTLKEHALEFLVKALSLDASNIVYQLLRMETVKKSLCDNSVRTALGLKLYSTISVIAEFIETQLDSQKTFLAACDNRDINAVHGWLNRDEFTHHNLRLIDNVTISNALQREDFDLLRELYLEYCENPVIPPNHKLLRPWSYVTNPGWRQVIRQFSELCKQSTFQFHLCGSNLYAQNPNDADVLINNANALNPTDKHELNRFIALLKENGAEIEPNEDGSWGYQKWFRHVIPLKFKGRQFEILLSSLSFEQHVLAKFDYTIGAMGYNLKTSKMTTIDGIDASNAIVNKSLSSIKPFAKDLFAEDISRLFRGLHLVVKHGYTISLIEDAIREIASGSKNPFLSMDRNQFLHQIDLLLNSEYCSAMLDTLKNWGLLNKVQEVVLAPEPLRIEIPGVPSRPSPYAGKNQGIKNRFLELVPPKTQEKDVAILPYTNGNRQTFYQNLSANQASIDTSPPLLNGLHNSPLSI